MPIPAQPFPGAAAAEMSRAGLQDPFAALTGLPPKSSPGSTGADGVGGQLGGAGMERLAESYLDTLRGYLLLRVSHVHLPQYWLAESWLR